MHKDSLRYLRVQPAMTAIDGKYGRMYCSHHIGTLTRRVNAAVEGVCMGHRKRSRRHYCQEPEAIVHEAAISLQRNGFIDFFIHAERNDLLDNAHIDFLFCKNTVIIPLQVKGNKASADKHRSRYPHIPVIIVKARRHQPRRMYRIVCLLKEIIEQTSDVRSCLDARTVHIIAHRIARERARERIE